MKLNDYYCDDYYWDEPDDTNVDYRGEPHRIVIKERDEAIERALRAEARIENALKYLDAESEHSWRRDGRGQLIEAIGCKLTGRSGSWWTGVR